MNPQSQLDEWAFQYGVNPILIRFRGYMPLGTRMGQCRLYIQPRAEIELHKNLLGNDCAS